MALSRDAMIAWRGAKTLHQRGAPVTIRRVTVLEVGGEPMRNPPEIRGDLVVATTASAGAATLTLTALYDAGLPGERVGVLMGFLAPDDRLVIDGLQVPLSVGAQAMSANNQIVVALKETVPATIAAGTRVTLINACDMAVLSMQQAGPRLVEDGQLTDVRSLSIRVSAHDLEREPEPQWTVVLATGLEHPIVATTPRFVQGVPVFYDLQIRQRG